MTEFTFLGELSLLGRTCRHLLAVLVSGLNSRKYQHKNTLRKILFNYCYRKKVAHPYSNMNACVLSRHTVCTNDLICLLLSRDSTCFALGKKMPFLPSGQSPEICAASVWAWVKLSAGSQPPTRSVSLSLPPFSCMHAHSCSLFSVCLTDVNV